MAHQAQDPAPDPTPGPDQLEHLFARNLVPLVAFIRARLGPGLAARESATDLAQSVCREVVQDLGQLDYRGEEAFRGWLFQQAVRKIIDRSRYLRRARRDIQREAGTPDDLDAIAACYDRIGTPSRHAVAREQLERLEGAVARLPDAQRDAVTMSRLMGLSYPEIASVMGVSEAAVRGLVARGLAAVAAGLG